MVFNPIFVPRTSSDDYQDAGKQSKIASANYMFSDIIKVYMNDSGENTLAGMQGTATVAAATAEGETTEAASETGKGAASDVEGALILSGEQLQMTKLPTVELVEFAAAFLPVESAKLSLTDTSGMVTGNNGSAAVIKGDSPLSIQVQDYFPSEFQTANTATLNSNSSTALFNTVASNTTGTAQQLPGLMQDASDKTFVDLQTAFAALTKQATGEKATAQPAAAQTTIPTNAAAVQADGSSANLIANTEQNAAATAKTSATANTAAMPVAAPSEKVSVQNAATPQATTGAATQSADSSTASPAEVKSVTAAFNTTVKEIGKELGFTVTEVRSETMASAKAAGPENSKVQSGQSAAPVISGQPKTTASPEVMTAETTRNNGTTAAPVPEESAPKATANKPGSTEVPVKNIVSGNEKTGQAVNTKVSTENTVVIESAKGNTPDAGTPLKTASNSSENIPSAQQPASTNTAAVLTENKQAAAEVKSTSSTEVIPAETGKAAPVAENESAVPYQAQKTEVTANAPKAETIVKTQVKESAPQVLASKAEAPDKSSDTAGNKVGTEQEQASNAKTATGNTDKPVKSPALKQVQEAATATAPAKQAPVATAAKNPAPEMKQADKTPVQATAEPVKDAAVKEAPVQAKSTTFSLPHVVKNDMPVRGIKRINDSVVAQENVQVKEKAATVTESTTKKIEVPTAQTAVQSKDIQQSAAPKVPVKAETTSTPAQAPVKAEAKPEVKSVVNPKEENVDTAETVKVAAEKEEIVIAKSSTPAKQDDVKAAVKESAPAPKEKLQEPPVTSAKHEVKSQASVKQTVTDNDTPVITKAKTAAPQKEIPVEQAVKAASIEQPQAETADTVQPQHVVAGSVAPKSSKPAAREEIKTAAPEKKDNPVVVEKKQAASEQKNTAKDEQHEQPAAEERTVVTKQHAKTFEKVADDTTKVKVESQEAEVKASTGNHVEPAVVQRETKSPVEVDKANELKAVNEKENSTAFTVKERNPELNTRETVHAQGNKTVWDNDAPFTPLKTVKASEAMKEVQTLIESKQKDVMVFQLDPENMGKMKVVLTNVENMLRARIEVETESARKSLEGNMQQLLQKLETNGVQVQSVQITLQQQDQNRRQPHYNQKRQQGQFAEEQGTPEEAAAARELGYNTVEYLV